MEKTGVKVAALYCFVSIPNPVEAKEAITEISKNLCIFGALILANEGLNGTIAGEDENIDTMIIELKALHNLESMEIKYSTCGENPFVRMRVSVKPEIVTMGCPEVNPSITKGTYVDPEDWNLLISDPDVIVIDTRNGYEINLGTFHRALNPNTVTFKEFPAYVSSNLNPQDHPKVAMFCTGGIRCEKASSFMLNAGFGEVFHLKGGILKYLETVAPIESLWSGECYVFDQRVSVGHGLVQGGYTNCRSCRTPLCIDTDLNKEEFEEGVSCHHCFYQLTESKKRSSTERQLQMILAKRLNKPHLGTKV